MRPIFSRPLGLRIVVTAIVVCSGGCGDGSSAGKTTTAASATPASTMMSAGGASSNQAAVAQFGGGHGVNADFAALEQAVRSDPDGLSAAALQHLGDPDPSVHYAAVYALVRVAKTDDSMKALRDLLAAPLLDDRLLAAGALVYRGDSSGIPVLIDALGSPDPMAFRDPPQTASDFARQQLLRFTSQDFGLRTAKDDSAAAKVKPAWQRWWDQHGAALRWDPAIDEFR